MGFYVISGRRLMAFGITIAMIMIAFHSVLGSVWKDTAIAQAISVDLTSTNPPSALFTLEVISVTEAKKPYRVFIYHTHTYEAYDMSDGNRYQPTETWRTADANYNVVRIGAELTAHLEGAGIQVTHDTTAYEMPRLSSAYSRSLEGLEKAVAEGYDLYIDLHRDSYSANNGPNTVTLDERALGRFLFLIGQGTGTELDDKPDWKANEKAAQCISDGLNAQAEGLSRGVSLKSGRYNQQAATPVILIEAGNNKNTLTEMLAAVPCLAQAICGYFDSLE